MNSEDIVSSNDIQQAHRAPSQGDTQVREVSV